MKERLDALSRRFARLATNAVVARPRLWRLFRGPLRRQFDWIAPNWEAGRSPTHGAAVEAALDRLEREPRRILDLGTGTGIAARLLARRYPAAEIVGVDLSPVMVEEARRQLPPELTARVRFEVGDGSRLPFRDGEFDLIVLLNMIPFFGEIARITGPGGTVVFASSGGSGTPIYVPPGTLRARLEPLGFQGFDELHAGEGNAVVARRAS